MFDHEPCNIILSGQFYYELLMVPPTQSWIRITFGKVSTNKFISDNSSWFTIKIIYRPHPSILVFIYLVNNNLQNHYERCDRSDKYNYLCCYYLLLLLGLNQAHITVTKTNKYNIIISRKTITILQNSNEIIQRIQHQLLLLHSKVLLKFNEGLYNV